MTKGNGCSNLGLRIQIKYYKKYDTKCDIRDGQKGYGTGDEVSYVLLFEE